MNKYHSCAGAGEVSRELSSDCEIPHRKFYSENDTYRERGNRALVVVLQSRQYLRLRNAFKHSVFEAQKLVSTKTVLLKHYYRRQGPTRAGEKSYKSDKTLARGGHPIDPNKKIKRKKKRSENAWANEIFCVGSHEFRESLWELLRELWFSRCTSHESPEPQNSQSDYFYCPTLSCRLSFPPFSLMKLAWWSWASGYQTNLSLCIVGKLLPD